MNALKEFLGALILAFGIGATIGLAFIRQEQIEHVEIARK